MRGFGTFRRPARPWIRKANSLLLALFLPVPLVYAQAPVAKGEAPEPEQQAPLVPGQVPAQGEAPAARGQEAGAEQNTDLDYWLGKLARAVTELEYSGLVTFEHIGMLETLRVVHAVRNGDQVERVRYLTGEPRELISHGSNANCPDRGNPAARAALWDRSGQREMQQSYQFVLRGEERIADRDTLVIEARPRDRHRLGVLVNLDRETGLPLKTMLVNSGGRVLERYQFVELDLSPVADSQLQPKSADARRIDNSGPCSMAQSRWALNWLPEGFKQVAVKTLSDGDMLVYSDGLNVFSVFVQRLAKEVDFRGAADRGATVAYMDRVETDGTHYTVTVVGEIPTATAQRLAKAVGTQ